MTDQQTERRGGRQTRWARLHAGSAYPQGALSPQPAWPHSLLKNHTRLNCNMLSLESIKSLIATTIAIIATRVTSTALMSDDGRRKGCMADVYTSLNRLNRFTLRVGDVRVTCGVPREVMGGGG